MICSSITKKQLSIPFSLLLLFLSLNVKANVGAPPQRVVALAPSLAEIAAEVLESERGRVVGVSDFTDFPAEYAALPQVGPYHRFNVEKVVSLKPDVVLATTDGNPHDRVLRLQEMGIRVVVVSSSSLRDIERSFELIGEALGRGSRGREMARHFHKETEAHRKRRKSGLVRKVVVQVGADPLVVVGGRGFLSEAIELLGAKNVFSDISSAYPRVSREAVVARNPDLILVMPLARNLSAEVGVVEDWNSLGKRAKGVATDEAVRPSFRFLRGLAVLDKALNQVTQQ